MNKTAILAACISLIVAVSSSADIYRWDNGNPIPGTQGIVPGPGVSLSSLDLSFADLKGFDLSGANFSSSNLMNAAFDDSALDATDFSRADLRGASGFATDESMILSNTIRPDGVIKGLSLANYETLVVRDGELPVRVVERFTIASWVRGTLEIQLSDRDWNSTIQIDPDAVFDPGGILRYDFAPGTTREAKAEMEGQTFDFFEWPYPMEQSNTFDIFGSPPGSRWDMDDFFVTGDSTMLRAPEPSSFALLFTGLIGVIVVRKRRKLRFVCSEATNAD